VIDLDIYLRQFLDRRARGPLLERAAVELDPVTNTCDAHQCVVTALKTCTGDGGHTYRLALRAGSGLPAVDRGPAGSGCAP